MASHYMDDFKRTMIEDTVKFSNQTDAPWFHNVKQQGISRSLPDFIGIGPLEFGYPEGIEILSRAWMAT